MAKDVSLDLMSDSRLKVFTNRRLAAALFLGFSSGMPLNLTASGSTFQAWMTDLHVDLTKIGLFALAGIPYNFKFLWSPWMDRFSPPFLGRRRGWILLTQLALVASILLLGWSNPGTAPGLTALAAVLVAFFGASQDIVMDAYRTDVLEKDEVGPGASLYILGFRVANQILSAVALVLADHLAWRAVYVVMAAMMGLCALLTLVAPEPRVVARPPVSVAEAVIRPFVEFFKRRGAWEMLLFILIYKLDVVMASAFLTTFMMKMGFAKTQIAGALKGAGFVAMLAGTAVGGAAMVSLGVHRSLWLFGLTQAFAGLSFMALARMGHSIPMMYLAVAVENFCSSMATAAFVAFLMLICDRRYTATQYALLTSLMALPRSFVPAPAGYLAEAWGWQNYFLVSVLISIPGLVLLLRYPTWSKPAEELVLA